MTDDIFYDGVQEVRRPRVVRETGGHRSSEVETPQEVYQMRVDTVFDQFADIIEMARDLLPIYEDRARALFIPVDELADDVRGAVSRKDQSVSDGSVIKFDLFRDALENFDRLRLNISIQAAQEMDGNPDLDAKRLQRIRYRVENADLDFNELILFASIFLARFTMWELQKQFAVPTIETMVAPKLPPAVEAPISIGHIIVSVLINTMVDIINEAALKLASEPSFSGKGGTNYSPLISKSKEADLTPMQKLAVRKVGEVDYQLILQYALNFIASTDDPKYHFWLAYMDSKEIRNRAIQHYRFGPQYSSKHLSLVNNLPPQVPETMVQDIEVTIRLPDRSATPELLKVIAIHPEHLYALETDAAKLQNGLNMIAQVVSSKFGIDMICCISRFFDKIDKDSLMALKGVLGFARGMTRERLTIDMGQTINNLLNYLSNGVRDFLLSFMEKVFAQVVDRSLALLDRPDRDWDLIFRGCPFMQTLVDFALKTIQQLKAKFTEMIQSIEFSSIDFGTNLEERYMSVYELRTFRVILDLIDRIISATIYNDCGKDDPGNIVLPELAKISNGLGADQEQYTVNFPPEILDRHFADSSPISIEANDSRPAYSIPAINEYAEAGDERIIMREVLDKCGRAISDEDLDRIFEATNGNT